MEKDKINELKQPAPSYILTPQKLNDIFEDLKKAISENSELIIESNKEDVKVYKNLKKLLIVIRTRKALEWKKVVELLFIKVIHI